jgi:hypothetical protein
MLLIHCRKVDKAAGTSFGKLGAFEIDANLDAAIGGTPERLHARPAGWDIGGNGRDIPWGNALACIMRGFDRYAGNATSFA